MMCLRLKTPHFEAEAILQKKNAFQEKSEIRAFGTGRRSDFSRDYGIYEQTPVSVELFHKRELREPILLANASPGKNFR